MNAFICLNQSCSLIESCSLVIRHPIFGLTNPALAIRFAQPVFARCFLVAAVKVFACCASTITRMTRMTTYACIAVDNFEWICVAGFARLIMRGLLYTFTFESASAFAAHTFLVLALCTSRFVPARTEQASTCSACVSCACPGVHSCIVVHSCVIGPLVTNALGHIDIRGHAVGNLLLT